MFVPSKCCASRWNTGEHTAYTWALGTGKLGVCQRSYVDCSPPLHQMPSFWWKEVEKASHLEL